MRPRRSHTKSRRGCQPCKKRRVKCDEQGPPCANCTIRDTDCIYVSLPHPTLDSSISADDIRETRGSAPHEQSMATPSEGSMTSSRNGVINAPPPGSRLLELELLHHYTTKTFKSFSVAGTNEDVWQYFVPREALKHEFLMNGILGIAALHMSTEHPLRSASYAEAGLHYQDLAFVSFRDTLQDVTKENCHSLFAFSNIAMAYAMISPRLTPGDNGLKSPTQTILLTYEFLQGVTSVSVASCNWLIDGPFGLFLDLDKHIQHGDKDNILKENIARLKSLNDQLLLAVDPTSHGTISSAINLLDHCFTGGAFMILAWLAMCGNDFMTLLKHGQRLAKLILMYWGVLLNRLNELWWVQDMGQRLIQELSPELQGLGPVWHDVVRHAQLQTGLDVDIQPLREFE